MCVCVFPAGRYGFTEVDQNQYPIQRFPPCVLLEMDILLPPAPLVNSVCFSRAYGRNH